MEKNISTPEPEQEKEIEQMAQKIEEYITKHKPSKPNLFIDKIDEKNPFLAGNMRNNNRRAWLRIDSYPQALNPEQCCLRLIDDNGNYLEMPFDLQLIDPHFITTLKSTDVLDGVKQIEFDTFMNLKLQDAFQKAGYKIIINDQTDPLLHNIWKAVHS